MSTDECIIGVVLYVDTVMADVPKHPETRLHPSEVVTLALLFTGTLRVKGVSQRASAPLVAQHLRRLVSRPTRSHALVSAE